MIISDMGGRSGSEGAKMWLCNIGTVPKDINIQDLETINKLE